MKNYMQTEDYMQHCMEEFYDINCDDLEDKLQSFLDVEFNKSTELDMLLTFDVLIELCRDKYRDFFAKTKKEYIHDLCNTLDDEDCAEIFNEYREYETAELSEYADGVQITHCGYCGKPIAKEQSVRCIEGDEYYCYEEIKTIEDIQKTCIGKELIRCDYYINDIMFMLGPDDNEYSQAINDGTFDSSDFKTEDGSYVLPEIFYTTAEA